MGGLGQSSDPLVAYNPSGPPLVPGLVEPSRGDDGAGQRHAVLPGHTGQIAIRAWAGNPADPGPRRRRRLDPGGRLGSVSAPDVCHTCFAGISRAHVQSGGRGGPDRFTGNAYFPGGSTNDHQGRFAEVRGRPSTDVVLQFATYHDAADSAALPLRRIHIAADDLTGAPRAPPAARPPGAGEAVLRDGTAGRECAPARFARSLSASGAEAKRVAR
jgi:hypothetical protein